MRKSFFSAIGFVLLLHSATHTRAQQLDMDWVELQGSKVIVHYSLNDADITRGYQVNLFTSQDNYTKELTKVSGDVGNEVRPGTDKQIVWDITKELGTFKGSIIFEVRGRIYVPFVKIKDIDEGRVFKRGKNAAIVWTSGNMSGQVNIELYKENERISGDNNQPNIGKYDWSVPSSARRGKNYRLKFTNVKDRNDVVFSQPFTIKPRVPLLVKILPVAVVAAVVKVASSSTSADKAGSKSSALATVPELP